MTYLYLVSDEREMVPQSQVHKTVGVRDSGLETTNRKTRGASGSGGPIVVSDEIDPVQRQRRSEHVGGVGTSGRERNQAELSAKEVQDLVKKHKDLKPLFGKTAMKKGTTLDRKKLSYL